MAIKRKFDKRIYNLKTLNNDMRKFISHSDFFVETILNPVISKHFSERVSMSVIQVNGCKLCSYTHTKNALKSGMSKEEIEILLSGGFDGAPKEELEALLFAQHYADTKGNPDLETKQKLLNTYGKEKTKDIMSHILLMMMTNLHGNTMEAFKMRLKGEKIENSSFWQELICIIHFFKIMPIILFKMIKYKIFTKKNNRN